MRASAGQSWGRNPIGVGPPAEAAPCRGQAPPCPGGKEMKARVAYRNLGKKFIADHFLLLEVSEVFCLGSYQAQ